MPNAVPFHRIPFRSTEFRSVPPNSVLFHSNTCVGTERGIDWNGTEWNGTEWNGTEWNGMERRNRIRTNGIEQNGRFFAWKWRYKGRGVSHRFKEGASNQTWNCTHICGALCKPVAHSESLVYSTSPVTLFLMWSWEYLWNSTFSAI